MSVTSAPPAFADPLAEDVLPSSSFTQARPPAGSGERSPQGRITRDRAALLAPDVEGRSGAEAIDLVRSSGLIAAIETVKSDEYSQQGLVIDQDPPAGTPMLREGVLTISVAQTPTEPPTTEEDAVPGYSHSSSAADDAGEDDTEQWFATLGPTAPAGRAPEPVAVKPLHRRRKHRPPSIPIPGQVPESTAGANMHAGAPLDIPLDPLPASFDSPTDELPNLSGQPARPGLFASLVVALLVRLPALSVSPTWRRRALVLAGALVGLLLLTRTGAPHSHHGLPASLAQASATRPRVATSPASEHLRSPFATSRRSRRRISRGLSVSPRRPSVPPRRPAPRHAPRESIATAAGAADPAPTSPPASPPPVPASERPGPFFYLGK